MNNSKSGAMVGTSSPSKLAPETIRIRNALIEKYADQPIEELNNFLQSALEAEKDELKRLGLLAARVYILRQKVLSLKAFIRDERMDNIPTPNLALTEQILLDETAHSDIDAKSESIASGEWHSLQMVEPGEVNGVRFFQGTVINARAEDAEKLISSGKAIVVDDRGNPIQENANDGSSSDDSSDPKPDANDGSIPLDDENADSPNSENVTKDEKNKDDSKTVDQKADLVDEPEAVVSNDTGIAPEDQNVYDPNPLKANMDGVIVDNSNTVDPKADVIDGVDQTDVDNGSIVSDEKNLGGPNTKNATEHSSEEKAQNKDSNSSEETKA